MLQKEKKLSFNDKCDVHSIYYLYKTRFYLLLEVLLLFLSSTIKVGGHDLRMCNNVQYQPAAVPPSSLPPGLQDYKGFKGEQETGSWPRVPLIFLPLVVQWTAKATKI